MSYELLENGAEITLQSLYDALADGFTLKNRGTGWWLAERRIPYRRTKSVRVADDLVAEAERCGVIRIEIPYISARAVLGDVDPSTGKGDTEVAT